MDTTHHQHQRYLAKFPDKLLCVSIVYAELESGTHLPSVCDMSFSAFCWQNFSIPSGELVRGGQHRFLDKDFLDFDGQFVFPTRSVSVIAIEVCLCANVQQALGNQPVFPKECVERFDMGRNCSFEGGIRRVICWRVSKEVFPADGVELVRPARAGGGG